MRQKLSRPTLGVLVVVFAIALVASACGDGAPADVSDEVIVQQLLSWGDPESRDLLERRSHAVGEDAVVECMALAGFEYSPRPFEAVGFGPGLGISREDFAARFGFGIATGDAYFAAAMEDKARTEDPNAAYTRALSIPERKTYSKTYFSCMDDLVFAPDSAAQGFIEDVRHLENAVRRTPEAIEAEVEWATCMVLEGEFGAVRSLEELTSVLQVEYGDSKGTPDVLASLQELEIGMAIRNLECERELNNALALIAGDFERTFIDANREAIADRRVLLGG